jgi:hypothetical protein
MHYTLALAQVSDQPVSLDEKTPKNPTVRS